MLGTVLKTASKVLKAKSKGEKVLHAASGAAKVIEKSQKKEKKKQPKKKARKANPAIYG